MRRFLSILIMYAIWMFAINLTLDWMLGEPSIVFAQSGRTFYINFSTGSNSNAGTISSPWKSHPFMQTSSGCTGGVTGWGGYSHQAGDTFDFAGGVTWPASCFPMTISQGGSSNAVRDTYTTADQNIANRAVFAGQNVVMDGMVIVGASNVNLSYLDVGGQKITSVNGNANGDCDQGTVMASTGVVNVTASYVWLHDWLVPAAPTLTGGSVGPVHGIVSGGLCVQNFGHPNVVLDHSEVSDAANMIGGQEVATGTCGGIIAIQYTHCHDLFEGIVNHDAVHDNEFNRISWPCTGSPPNVCGGDLLNNTYGANKAHSNIIESSISEMDGPVYNNYIHDIGVFGEVIDECAQGQIYNNVITGPSRIAIRFQWCTGDSASSVAYVYNNVVDGSTCFNRDGDCPWDTYFYGRSDLGGNLAIIKFQNNISIGTSFSIDTSTSGSTATPNRQMNAMEAQQYGFVPGNKYNPSSADPNTAGQGANLTALASGGLAALTQDTSGAPWFGGAYKTRPTGSTGWDMGPYLGQGGSVGPPSISISTPSPGTVSGSLNLTAACTPQSPATCTSVQYTIDGFPFGSSQTSSPYTLSWNTGTAANGTHVIGATATDSNSQIGTAGTVTVTVSNSIPGCFISSDNDSGSLSWTANQAIGTQSANFTSTVTITPNTANQDTVFAISQAPMMNYGQGAVVILFNSSGNIQVWNGSTGYTSDNPATYSAGTAYTFTIAPNFTGGNAGKFSVSETSPSSIVIATLYAFRSTASFASLGFINSIADNTTPDTQKVCSFQVGAGTSLTFSPLSLNFGNVTVSSGMPTLTIGVTSAGGSTTFSNVGISGNSDFTINSNGCTGSQTSCSTVIKFAPTATGVENATVTFTDSATGSPQSYAVSGTGIPAASSATPSPTSVNFGNVQLGTCPPNCGATSGPIIVTLMNGPVTFAGTPITFDNPDFTVASNTCTGSVSVPTCQTTVNFKPSSLSNETATMTYHDNAPSGGSTQMVALVGTGVNFPVPAPATQFVFSLPIQHNVALTMNGATIGTFADNFTCKLTCTPKLGASPPWVCVCN